MPEGDGLQERKGRFKIKQVEAAEAEEASYPEGDILGGRIKGPERGEGGPAPMALHHHHLHQHNTPRLDADNSGVSAMSDLTDSVGKSMNKLDKSEKKGRFIIRELPEVPPPEPPGSTGSASSSTSHHVHIDPHPHVYAPHHPAAPSSSSNHTRPPPHPYGSQASMNRPSSNQQLDGHGSGSSLSRPSSQQHLDSSSQHDLAFRVGDSPSGQPYSPLFHSQFPSSSSLQDVGWIDPEMARIIRQQNELILQRLAHMDKTFHQHMAAMPATTPADKTGLIKGKEGGGETPTSTTTSATTMMKDTSSGKLTYLLDQMKNEVESAVSKRRELDLQMKRLQEKNRALEEKVDEEKAKRIAAEKKFEKMREKSEQLMTEIAYYQEQFAKLSYSTSSSSTSPIQIPPSSTPQQGGGGVAVGGGQLGGSGSGKIGDVTAQQQLLQQQAAQSNASFSDFMQASFNAHPPSSTSGTSGGGGAAGVSKAHMSVETKVDDFASLKPSSATGLPPRASSSPIPVPGHKQTGSGGHLDQSIGGGPGSGGQQQQRGGSIGGSTAPPTAGGSSAAATDPFNALISNVAGLGLGSNPGSSSSHATRTSLSSSNNNHHHSNQSPTDDAFAELVNRSTSGKPSGPSPSNSSNNLKGQGHARRDSNSNLV